MIDLIKIIVEFIMSKILLIIVIFIIGFLIDILKKKNYIARDIHIRENDHGDVEYYCNFWDWQPNKRNHYLHLLKEKGLEDVTIQRGRKRNSMKLTILPFRKEIRGKRILK